MLIAFVRAQNRRRFSASTVLLLGPVYELGADGMEAQIIVVPFGDSQLLDPTSWFVRLARTFWRYILVYSSMVLPPAWLVVYAEQPEVPGQAAWRDALRPTVADPIYSLLLAVDIDLGVDRRISEANASGGRLHHVVFA